VPFNPPPNLYRLFQLGCVVFFPIFFSCWFGQSTGVVWDEPSYILSGIRYLDWFKHLSFDSFSPASIQESWFITHEHPPLAKLGFGLCHFLFSDTLGIIASSRFFNALLYGLLCLSVFLFCAKRYSTKTAWIAWCLLQNFPRFSGHSCIALLDFPVAVFWSLGLFCFFLGTHNKKYFWIGALLYAALWLTKLTGIFLLLPCVIWGFFYARKVCLKMVLVWTSVAWILFFALNPWMALNPREHFSQYLGNKTARILLEGTGPAISKDMRPPVSIPVFYLGKTYQGKNTPVPWHYVPLMFLSTTSPLLLILLGLGLWQSWRHRKSDSFATLCILNLICIFGLCMIPLFPKYGSVRFFLHAYPLVAILGALGWNFFCKTCDSLWIQKLKTGILTILLTWNFVSLCTHRDHLLCDYSETVGRLPGALHLGLPLTDLEATLSQETFDWINTHCPPNGKVILTPLGNFVQQFYQTLGYFRKDIQIVDHWKQADIAVVFLHPEYFDEDLKSLFNQTPAFQIQKENVTLVKIFEVPLRSRTIEAQKKIDKEEVEHGCTGWTG
jgi:4-amino-4-deoxy-L-arabinose transferase-like glycosyltransferase